MATDAKKNKKSTHQKYSTSEKFLMVTLLDSHHYCNGKVSFRVDIPATFGSKMHNSDFG